MENYMKIPLGFFLLIFLLFSNIFVKAGANDFLDYMNNDADVPQQADNDYEENVTTEEYGKEIEERLQKAYSTVAPTSRHSIRELLKGTYKSLSKTSQRDLIIFLSLIGASFLLLGTAILFVGRTMAKVKRGTDEFIRAEEGKQL